MYKIKKKIILALIVFCGFVFFSQKSLAVTTPGAPTDVVATAASATSISIAFIAPDDGGSAITGYKAACVSLNGGVTGFTLDTTELTSPIIVGSLTASKVYICQIRAVNALGDADYATLSSNVDLTPVDGVCGAADGVFYEAQPDEEDLCLAGTVSIVGPFPPGGPWTWSCLGVAGGEDDITCSTAEEAGDTTPPVITAFTIPATSSSLTIPISTFIASDDSGTVTGYLVNESSTVPAASSITSEAAPTSYIASSSGTKTLYAWVKDAAGNVSVASTGMTCTIDMVAPSAIFSSFETSDNTPTIAGSYSDSPSSITVHIGNHVYSAVMNLDGTWTAEVTSELSEATYSVLVKATDSAGNYTDKYVNLTIYDSNSDSSDKKSTAKKIKDSDRTVKRGDILVQSGKNFPKNRKVLLFFQRHNGSYYPPQTVTTDSTGKFSVRYKVNKPSGVYNWFSQDYYSGVKSWSKYRIQ